MPNQQEAYHHTAELLFHYAPLFGVVSLATGLLFSNSLCDMDLANWNFVNAGIAAGITGSANLALKSSPKVMQNSWRCLKMDISHGDLMADGALVGLASLGLAFLPIAAFLWALNGFASMGVGICAESAPLFFGITLIILLSQICGLLYFLSINLQAAGYDMQRIQGILHDIFIKAKGVAMDIYHNGFSYAQKAFDTLVPMAKSTLDYILSKVKELWQDRPNILTANYWAGPEGQYLLH